MRKNCEHTHFPVAREVPRVVIAATNSGAGKTSVSIALMAALAHKGLSVSPFKVGPDYIDPAFHAFVAGSASRNLDSWMLTADAVLRIFLDGCAALEPGRGIAVIEGVMGCFDGQGAGNDGSTAHVAELLQAPVLLVVNARGMSRSAAAMVAGYRDFSPAMELGAVIFNQVSGDKHYNLLKDIVESETGVRCAGYLPHNADFSLKSRHLGLIPAEEAVGLRQKVEALASAALQTIDLDAVIILSRRAPALPYPVAESLSVAGDEAKIRMAVARDAAFSFYYQDNLDLLSRLGAKLVYFSPLADSRLPEGIHGLYLGGGFPEEFAERLCANHAIRRNIRELLLSGLPGYAECGGMLYLCQSLTDSAGKSHDMCGFFPDSARMAGRLQRFGYVEAEILKSGPLGPAGTSFRGHEFHHSILAGPDCGGNPDPAGVIRNILKLEKPGKNGWTCGLMRENVQAWYAHVHFHANPAMAASFVASMKTYADAIMKSGHEIQK